MSAGGREFCRQYEPAITISLNTRLPSRVSVLTTGEGHPKQRFGRPRVTIDATDTRPAFELLPEIYGHPSRFFVLEIWRRDPRLGFLNPMVRELPLEYVTPHYHLGMGIRLDRNDEHTDRLLEHDPPHNVDLLSILLNTIYRFRLGSDAGWQLTRQDVPVIHYGPKPQYIIWDTLTTHSRGINREDGTWQGNPEHPFRLNTTGRPCVFEYVAEGSEEAAEDPRHIVIGVRFRYPNFDRNHRLLLATMVHGTPEEATVREIYDPYFRISGGTPTIGTKELT